MPEAQLGGVQGKTGRAAWVRATFAARLAIVHFFATDWMAQLRQVNANLMRSPGFQPAAHHGIAGQFFNQLDVRDGLFADARQLGAAAPTVAAISDQSTGDSL